MNFSRTVGQSGMASSTCVQTYSSFTATMAHVGAIGAVDHVLA